MADYDASQTGSNAADSGPIARPDVDSLPTGSFGPATGNVITGAGTTTGASGADTPGTSVSGVQGAGGPTSGSDGNFQASGQYGVLSMDAQGNYNYVRNPGTPDGVQDVFNYTVANAQGATASSTLSLGIGAAGTAVAQGIVNLPAGVELSDVHVVGRDLIIDMPDGTHLTIPGGAVFVPQLVIGDVAVPSSNLAALLIDSEPQPAAGNTPSSGGNFAVDVPPLDPGVPLGDLIPPTELTYTPPEFRPVGQFEDTQPSVIIITPDFPAGAVDASESVNEKGLPAPRDGDVSNESVGSGEGADGNGSNNSDGSETNTGTIVFTAQDGLQSVTLNGVAITGVGQTFQGQYGTLTITSIANGQIGYSYTLTDNTSGDTTHDDFAVVVTDTDGDTATGTLTVNIIDDVPTARNDTDSVDLQTGLATGNVVTAVGTTSGASGADTLGADNATVTGVHPGTTGNFTAVPQDTSSSDAGVLVHGQFGDLVLHDDGSYTYTVNPNAGGGGTDVFTYQLTDGDGDTSTATLTITNPDHSPTGGSTSTTVDEDGLPNGIAGGPGDVTVPNTDGDNNEATNAGTLPGGGGDGQLTFDLLTTGAPSGFQYIDGPNGSIIVQQDQGGNWVSVMTVTINAQTGAYTVTLTAPMDHPTTGTEDSLPFSISYTVTDADGDHANGTLNISVNDDSPEVTGVEAGPGVTLDETTAGDPSGFPISADSGTSVITGTIGYGADGAGTTAYGLDIVGNGNSGISTAIGDHPITLVQIDADTIQGQYQDGGTQVAFTIDIDSNGVVTVTQEVPLEHLVDGSTPADYNDTLDLSGLVNATITVTDADGDTASGSVGIGGNIVFYDDGPSVTVDVGSDSDITLVTQDADTIGLATDHDTADFSGVFTIGSSSGGGDGAASTDWQYALSATDHTDSGLTQGGNIIYLYELDDGSVVGSTATSENNVSSANTVFSVTVDGSGVVTLNQFSQIDHPIADDPNPTDAPFDDQGIHLADDAITLTATATVTDNDGDTATGSQSVGIGGNITFEDDGPTVSNVNAGAGVSIDETTAGDPSGFPISATSLTAAITATTSSGADTPATTTYGLTLPGGVDSIDSGLQTAIGDHEITLVQIDGDTIQGQYQDGGTQVAFTLDIGSDGKITVTQDVPLEHLVDGNTPADYNDTLDLSGLVNATITVTDYDGDTATGSAAVGDNIVFYDDGPSVTVNAGADGGITLETQDHETIGGLTDHDTADFSGVFTIGSSSGGGDGAASTDWTYALGATDHTNSGLTQGGTIIYLYQLDDGSVVGSTATSENNVNAGNTVFSVTVDGSGVVTLNQFSQIDHPIADDPSATESPFDDQGIHLSDNAITLTATATVTDNDGDTATGQQTIGIGANITFDDDGPTATNDSSNAVEGTTLTVLTSVLSNDQFGADGPLGGTQSVTSVTHGLVTQTPSGGNIVIAGTYGTLTMHSDGTYTYLAAQGSIPPAGATETFSYTITDGDGDTASATLTIDVANNNLTPSAGTVNAFVDDEGLAGGILGNGQSSGDINANAGEVGSGTSSEAIWTGTLQGSGGDAPISFSFAQSLDGTAVSGGVGQEAATWNVSADGLTLEAIGPRGVIFTVVITNASTGAYTLTLNDNVLNTQGDNTEASAFVNIPYTVTDVDSSTATGTIHAEFNDDMPSAVSAAAITSGLSNGGGDSQSANLDGGAGGNSIVADNMGADGGKVIFTAASITSLQGQNLTHNLAPLSYVITNGGQTLTGYVDGNHNSTVDNGETVFTIELQPSGQPNNYLVTMVQSLDTIQTIDFNGGGYNFVGGNGSWAGFTSGTNGDGIIDLLLTPMVNGANSSTMNTNANEGGVGSGNSVALGEGVRVDTVQDLQAVPAPTPSGDYGILANENHVFGQHENVIGISALISTVNGPPTATTDINLIARDEAGASDTNDLVGDGTQEAITKVVITHGASTVTVLKSDGANQTVTVDGHSVNVVFGAMDATVNGILAGTRVGAFTADGFDSLEIKNVGGQEFKVGDFNTLAVSSGPLDVTVPISVVDGDGDTVSSGNLGIHIDGSSSSSAAVVNTMMATNTLSTNSVNTTSLVGTNDNHQQQHHGERFGNTNTAALLGAVAAAGLSSANELAAQGLAGHAGSHGAPSGPGMAPGMVPTTQFSVRGESSTHSDALQGGHIAGGDHHLETSHLSAPAVSPLGLAGHAPGPQMHGAPLLAGTEGGHGATHGHAFTAGGISMPSAQQLAAHGGKAGGVGGDAPAATVQSGAQSNAVVGQVLADALAGGHLHGPNLDTLLHNATGGQTHDAKAALAGLASQFAETVSNVHSGHFGGFAFGPGAPMMEHMVIHQDAVQAHS